MNIKEVIKRKGLTINEVADNMNISRVGLSQHINGNPSVEVLERIALAIGCEVGDFFIKEETTSLTCPNCGKELELKIKE